MTKMDEKANGWLEKVNAKFFCGVDFFKFGVLTETWFEAKFLGYYCTKKMVCAGIWAKKGGRSPQKAAQIVGNVQVFCVE